jgi:hypothetical protein
MPDYHKKGLVHSRDKIYDRISDKNKYQLAIECLRVSEHGMEKEQALKGYPSASKPLEENKVRL